MRRLFFYMLSFLTSAAVFLSVHPPLLKAQTIPAPTHRKTYSVLSLGPTLKVSVTENGVYKITYEDLVSNQLLTQPVAVEKISVYGNLSGMQPYFNTPYIYDDLASLPIYIHDNNSDGMFGPGDRLNFYGESPNRFTATDLSADPYPFEFTKNHYSDKTFYFVGTNGEYASRPAPSPSPEDIGEYTARSTFAEHLLYEEDLYNLCSGGVNFYGNRMANDGSTESVSFSTVGADAGTEALLYVKTVASTGTLGSGTITISAGGARDTAYHKSIPTGACHDIRERNLSFPHSASNLTVRLAYSKSSNAGSAYLDRAILYYTRKLETASGSLCFRIPQSAFQKTLFQLSSSASGLKVWDVSDIYAIKEPTLTYNNGTYTFKTDPDQSLHEYAAFDPATCPEPVFEGKVQVQNLHAEKNIDYVMVSHPDFMEQARAIAELHAELDGYSVLTVSTEEVYNEFSSGSKDPSAIRLLMRHLWKVSDSSRRPRYLCLMGATYYDYRHILDDGYDFIPSFQSYSNTDISEHGGDPVEDNFGYLEDDEGFSPVSYIRVGKMDIGVGRLPVRTAEEAEAVLEKIKIYSSPVALQDVQPGTGASNFGDWRNEITAVTDDWFEQFMERMILKNDEYFYLHPEYHINKLYSDCYLRNSTSTSTRIPEMENALRNRIENGSLFIGYEGHSGADAWSDEKIITSEIIDNLASSYSYPIMASSSCSFALFDQGTQVSGAEKLVLHPKGGAIAVMGTVRSATQNNIEDIHSRFLYALSDKSAANTGSGAASGHPTIGSAYLKAKVNNTQGAGHKFILLGDPGLKTALPRYEVKTLKINGRDAGNDADSAAVAVDTLRALGTVTVEGCVTDRDGRILSGFNGSVLAKVYDKAITSQTLGLFNSREHFNNPVVPFTIQNSLIFQGVSQVDSGRFSFSFIVPKDIMYDYGFGKISYYAYSDTADANGAFTRMCVGGFDADAVTDTLPPTVRLRIGGENSIGTVVGVNPVLYAEISDEYGINTTGSGIGHDMELVIDGDEANSVVVNSLFRYDFGSYKSGSITYPMGRLSPGGHTAKLKVWNINNVSATATIAFTVDAGGRTEIFDLTAAPNPNRGDYVDFYFTHNGEPGSVSECNIQVFDLMGKRVADLHYDMEGDATYGGGFSGFGNGHSVGPLRWEISQSGIKHLEAGIYICRVLVNGSDGKKVGQSVKLVVM